VVLNAGSTSGDHCESATQSELDELRRGAMRRAGL
jgi:hypothetical protein